MWGRLGYLQPQGTSVIAPNWSFLPGTYRGGELGARIGDLSLSYFHADRYKAPWYQSFYEFRQADGETIDYLHSLGARYDVTDDLAIEAAFGQAQGYMDQGFGKVSYATQLNDSPLRLSYQTYAARDRHDDGSANDVYDGTAWQQVLTAHYDQGAFDWRLEFSWVHAPGSQGYFLPRMTTPYASSNGRLDIWWDARSDWNHDGEKSLYAGVTYDLEGWDLPGWSLGLAHAYGWDARPYSGFEDPGAALVSPPGTLTCITKFRMAGPRARVFNCTIPATTTAPTTPPGEMAALKMPFKMNTTSSSRSWLLSRFCNA